jgi:hypothetical protein
VCCVFVVKRVCVRLRNKIYIYIYCALCCGSRVCIGVANVWAYFRCAHSDSV